MKNQSIYIIINLYTHNLHSKLHIYTIHIRYKPFCTTPFSTNMQFRDDPSIVTSYIHHNTTQITSYDYKIAKLHNSVNLNSNTTIISKVHFYKFYSKIQEPQHKIRRSQRILLILRIGQEFIYKKVIAVKKTLPILENLFYFDIMTIIYVLITMVRFLALCHYQHFVVNLQKTIKVNSQSNAPSFAFSFCARAALVKVSFSTVENYFYLMILFFYHYNNTRYGVEGDVKPQTNWEQLAG